MNDPARVEVTPERRAKMTPKIILEGTRLTHKTDLAFALNEHPRIVGPRRYRYHSPLISAEWCGFSPFPWGRGPIDYDPDQEALAMETYATWARLFELQRYYSWIVDRFHLSTRAFQLAERGRDVDFGWLEERLLPLGFHVALLVRRPETFEAARAERLDRLGQALPVRRPVAVRRRAGPAPRAGGIVPAAGPRVRRQRRRPQRRLRPGRRLARVDRGALGASLIGSWVDPATPRSLAPDRPRVWGGADPAPEVDAQPAGAVSASWTVVGSESSSGSVQAQAAPWWRPTAPWRAASTRSGSPKISMKPTAAAWSKASPSSYVARLRS